jgi:crotonobetainyl-CoA:carnitine CoA-transferase CaiB-like acyl-CoA transferase
MPGPWSGVRVLELTGLTGAYATRIWAALGAEVIVVEPPGGHLLRSLPPFAPGQGGPDASLWWAFFAQGKRSVVAEPGTDSYDRLLASADVVIADVDPALGAPTPAHPEQVFVAVSPFGLSGPRKGWKGSELLSWASSGLAFTIGFPERPPVGAAPPVQFAAHVTSMYAMNAAMLALRGRRRTGKGQVVDVSMQECLLTLAPETGVPMFLDDRVHRPRPGNRRRVSRPWGLYPCADGFVSTLIVQPAHWRRMAAWIAEVTEMESVLDEAFVDLHVRWEVAEFIDDLTEQLTRPRTKLDLFTEGQRRGIPMTPVNTVADLRADPHLTSCGFWRDDDNPVLGTLNGPGAPFRVNHEWWQWASAPRLGEHNDEALARA